MSNHRRGEISQEAYLEKLVGRSQTPEGAELPDATPMSPPLGYIKQPSITERIREMVRSEHLRQAAEASGRETFEEADDFDVVDDLEPLSGYENDEQFEPAIPSEPSTGVPSPSGEGKGQGGAEEPTASLEPAAIPASVPPAPASPKAS